MMEDVETIEENIRKLKEENDQILKLCWENINKNNNKIKRLANKRDHLLKHKYYTYIVYVDGVVKYIGKGSGSRWRHPLSGSSSVKELNRDLFDGKHIEVRIMFSRLNYSEEESLRLEEELLSTCAVNEVELYNKNLPDSKLYFDADFRDYSDFVGSTNGKPYDY